MLPEPTEHYMNDLLGIILRIQEVHPERNELFRGRAKEPLKRLLCVGGSADHAPGASSTMTVVPPFYRYEAHRWAPNRLVDWHGIGYVVLVAVYIGGA